MRRRRMLGLVVLGLWPGLALGAEEEAAIRHLLHHTFDRPEQRLLADPIIVVGDHALVGWSQGETGGRALLQRRASGWAIVLCGGVALKGPALLLEQGMPPGQATALAEAMATAEARLGPDRIALFDSFEGLMLMEEGAAHPPPALPAHPQ